MNYHIEVSPGAARDIKKLPVSVAAEIARAIRELAYDPRPSGAKRLKGISAWYRIRKGIYRVIYTIDDDILRVGVVTVGHRKEVYRNWAEKAKQRGQ